MGKIMLVTRLAVRDIRRHQAQAVLLLLAITAATATLVLGLALDGVTNHPYEQTRAATNGPDLVASYGVDLGHNGPGPAAVSAAQIQADAQTLTHLNGVTGYSGPYPIASVVLRVRGLTVPVQAEGRSQTPAAVDQPKLTAGSWVRPGGVVIERTFATALSVGVGDRVTLDGRPFTVTGIAVTAAAAPYPNCYLTSCMFTGPQMGPGASSLSTLNVGLTWVTEADARAMASPQAPLTYVVNLKLKDPATAPDLVNQIFADGGISGAQSRGIDSVYSWQDISSAAGQLVQDQQGVLRVGALLAVLLAVASAAVLAGGRMAERTRRVGLLKAVGSTPSLVAAVLVAENLALALLAAAAGLVIGWAAAPLITNPGAGLVGSAGAPSITPATIGLTVALALAVALASTLVPAIRAARSSTVSALADSPRPPRRRAMLIALSARLPVPLLLGVRMTARRLRRAALGAASIAVTTAGIVAVLTFRATVDHDLAPGAGQVGDPVVARDTQMLVVITTVLVALAVLNAVCAAWATVQDSRRSAAQARALGASPRQVSAAVAWAQVLPAVPGALLGIPLGIGLFKATDTGVMTIPPVWWLAAAVVAIVAAVAAVASVPALIGARIPPSQVLQAETA
jgi:putative ABC transport system permease protein